MDYVDFGKTGLRTSVAGLGCGGHSRLGQKQGASQQASINLVRAALDQGINFIDTAANYGTEEIVGLAIAGQRDKVILSSKAPVTTSHDIGDDYVSGAQLRASCENSLQALGTDYIDVFHLHAVSAGQYDYCCSELLPEMLALRDEGKIRFLAISERFIEETAHEMLYRAIKDDHWDVMMIGFNMLNPSARREIFVRTQAKGIATLVMFAVRRALSNKQALADLIEELVAAGKLEPGAIERDDPLGFLLERGDAASISEAAYRFCRHEPGVDLVLTGTGNIDHLAENVASICQGSLGQRSLDRLRDLFGDIDSVSGN